MLGPHSFGSGARIEVGNSLREPSIEAVQPVSDSRLRHTGRNAVATADRDVAVSHKTGAWRGRRSEEHTSELQSQFHLVCRLLLEKKKKKTSRQLLEKKKQVNVL